LHNHDCVIVPKMGAFISHHSLDIKKSQETKSAFPQKVSFNDLLNYNDGLLANHIAKEERLSYAEALDEIERFVFESQRDLSSGKKIVVERIGVLYKDEASNILMEPIKETGAPVEIKKPDHIEAEIENQSKPDEIFTGEKQNPVIEKIQPTPLEIFPPKVVQEKPKAPKTRTVGIFAFLIIAGLIISFGYFFFSSDHETNYSTPSLTLPVEEKPKEEIQNPPTVIKEPEASALELLQSTPKKNEKKEVVKKVVIPVPAVKTSESKQKKSGIKYYYIVAGSFRSMENANQKLKELFSQGYKNAVVFTDERKLQLVSYGKYTTLDEVNRAETEIKKLHKDAWVYGK
jgi:hypothetical protein